MVTPKTRVSLGPFMLDDMERSDFVHRIARAAAQRERTVKTAGLHVAALRHANRRAFIDALTHADLIYPDGMSFVLLGRLANARHVERTPLTDVGHEILQELVQLRARARIFLLGGPEGLAAEAGERLKAQYGVWVETEHGYHRDWRTTIQAIRDHRPHLMFVGLGLPLETEWIHRFAPVLPPTTLIGCGGWFGHVAGAERRAPEMMQVVGLEWAWRLAQDPQRLVPRYVVGGFLTFRLAVRLAWERFVGFSDRWEDRG